MERRFGAFSFGLDSMRARVVNVGKDRPAFWEWEFASHQGPLKFASFVVSRGCENRARGAPDQVAHGDEGVGALAEAF